MIQLRFLIIIGLLLLNTGCFMHTKVSQDNEKTKVERCMEKWNYKDLTKKQEVTILLFNQRFNTGVSSFPNFLVVLTTENDTIGFLDKDFNGKLSKGNTINILPLQWNEAEKSIKKPALVIHKKTNDNELYCKIKEVYYGKLEPIK